MLWNSLMSALMTIVLTQSAPPAVTHVAASDIVAAMAAAPTDRVSDQQIRMVDAGGYNVGIGVVHRPPSTTPGGIQHHAQTEVYRVIEGSGTLVTGPDLDDRRDLDPNGRIVRELIGPSSFGVVRGGESREVGAGDFLIIPAGLAHGFSEVREAITYVVVRIDPDQTVALK